MHSNSISRRLQNNRRRGPVDPASLPKKTQHGRAPCPKIAVVPPGLGGKPSHLKIQTNSTHLLSPPSLLSEW